MDKDFRVRLEFERTGQLDAWRRLRQHNRQQNRRLATPQSHLDEAAMQKALANYSDALHEFRFLSKKGEQRYFMEMAQTLLLKGRERTLAHPRAAALLRMVAPHRHLAVRPVSDFAPRGHSPENVAYQLAQHLFGGYSISAWIWHAVWHYADTTLLMPAIYQLQGRSLRELPQPPRPLSKRLLHHFLRAPVTSSYMDAYRWAQIRRWGGNMGHFSSIKNQLVYVPKGEEPFWEQVLSYLVRHPPLSSQQFFLLKAYLRYQRFGIHDNDDWNDGLPGQPPNPSFKFQHLSPDDLLVAAKAHEDECTKLYQARRSGWESRVPEPVFGFMSIDRSEVWETVELTSAQALILESRKMRHCVKTYVNYCLRGESSIFSIRRNGKPVATIDLNPKTLAVDQVQGPCNTPLEGDVLEAYNLWRNCMGAKG